MNIEIKSETIQPEPIITKSVSPVVLTPEELDGIVELLIQAGGMSASERIGSHNLQLLTITADSQQGAEDGHTVFKPVYRVDIVLK